MPHTAGMTTPSATATTRDGRPVELARDDEGHRYTATLEGRTVAIADVAVTSELVVFTHTETDPSVEGQGVASTLVAWALDDVRGRGLAVLPLCPFVKAYIGRHADRYADIVYGSRTGVVHD